MPHILHTTLCKPNKGKSKQAIRPSLIPTLLFNLITLLLILHQHAINNLRRVPIRIVNLIWQHRTIDKCLLSSKHHRQHNVYDGRRAKSKEPAELIRVNAYADADIGVDGVDEPRQAGSDTYHKGGDCAPIGAVPVAVYVIGLVEGERIILHLVDDPEIHDHDGGDWAEEYTVCRHEVEETAGRLEDLPWDQSPREDRAKDLTSADIDVAWEQGHQVIGS